MLSDQIERNLPKGCLEMPQKARSPEEVHDLFAQALAAGDVEAVMSLYEPDAILVPGPDQVARGQATIGEGLASYLASKPMFKLQASRVIQNGELALLFSTWTIKETDSSGTTVESVIHPTQIIRQQQDGTWRVVIDNPSRFE